MTLTVKHQMGQVLAKQRVDDPTPLATAEAVGALVRALALQQVREELPLRWPALTVTATDVGHALWLDVAVPIHPTLISTDDLPPPDEPPC